MSRCAQTLDVRTGPEQRSNYSKTVYGVILVDERMLAVVKEEEGEGFALKRIPVPAPSCGEVLTRVKTVGICGTDVSIFAGKRKVPLPLVPGHEFAGEIVEIGPRTKGFQIGDKVTAGLVIGCGKCSYCRTGNECLCDNIKETGIHVDGAFAEYVVTPVNTVHRLPDGMSFEQGASIDPIASAYRAVKKARIGSEDTVVVYGPGPIGLYAMGIAKVEGAAQVMCVGVPGDERRLEVAKALGADHIVLGREDEVLTAIEQITSGYMANVVIEATGRSEVVPLCLRSLRKGGRLSVAGVFHEPSTIETAIVVRHELSIYGSICYTWNDFRESLSLVQSGRVKPDRLISHQLPLSSLGEGLSYLANREAIKVILYP